MWIALHADDDLCLIGQHRAVHILHHAADGIDQRGVVGIFMVDEHMPLAHNLQSLAYSVFVAKETMGQPLCDDALVGGIEGRQTVALHQRKVEHLEERRVGQHDDAVLAFGILHLFIPILYTSPLAHHAAGLLHIGAQLFDALRCLRPQEEMILFAHQVDAVGILMPRVDAKLSPGVVAYQDDEHQRHHQARYINKGI